MAQTKRPTARAKDTINGALGECFIRMKMNRDGTPSDLMQRYRFAQVEKLDTDMEYTKESFTPLGQSTEVSKTTGEKGTGSATFIFNTAMFLMMYKYHQETGQELYFDLVVTLDDDGFSGNDGSGDGSSKGQTVTHKNCLLDKIPIARLDTSSKMLKANLSFTYESVSIGNTFRQTQEGFF